MQALTEGLTPHSECEHVGLIFLCWSHFILIFQGFVFAIFYCVRVGACWGLCKMDFSEWPLRNSPHFLHVSTLNASLFSFHSSHASLSPSFSTCPLLSITSLLPSICSSFQIIAFITESLSARLSPSAGVHDYCPENQLIPPLSASP